MVTVIQCADRVGLVAAIAGVFAKEDINIVSMREHVDAANNHFFMRVVTEIHSKETMVEDLLKKALPAGAEIKVNPSPEKKAIILVTKEYHCLGDILIRNHFKTLGAKVLCVIGNHPTLENICERFDIPFHLVSHDNKNREAF
jgi:formyltetrahydrofolate deformylase